MRTFALSVALLLGLAMLVFPTASAARVPCVVGPNDDCIVRIVQCVREPCPPEVRCIIGSDGDCLIPIFCFTDPCPRFP
jgi:hypothetical protein